MEKKPAHNGWEHDGTSATLFLDQHYSPETLGNLWGWTGDRIKDLFDLEPGVIKDDKPETLHKRAYCSLRIPKSVAQRVHCRLQVKK